MNEFTKKINLLLEEFNSVSLVISNSTRRKLYSQSELIKLDIEEYYLQRDKELDETANFLIQKIGKLNEKLNIKPAKRTRYIVDDICRFLFINSSLYFLGLFASVPLLIVKNVENFFPRNSIKLSLILRQWYAWIMLTSAGVSTVVIDAEAPLVKQSVHSHAVPILAVAHTSNLDGFLASLTCPSEFYAIVKKELFLVPFFSWLSLAIGAIPVDRQNRDRAIRILDRSAAGASSNSACLVICPEGTRSTTGQLQEFKKGTFHVWEQLGNSPIIPMIVFGGYELFPVGDWLNTPGRVVVTYLPAIKASEASNRDEMMRVLRRRILNGLLMDPAAGAAAPLSFFEYLLTYAVGVSIFLINISATRKLNGLICNAFEVESGTATLFIIFGSMFVTLVLYTYHLYIVDLLYRAGKSSQSKEIHAN